MFVACAPGLEPWLAAEVEALAPGGVAVPGGVEVHGDRRTLARLLVELGLASHVLVRIASFRCRALEDLEPYVERLPWSGWLRRDEARQVRVTTTRSRITHTGAIAERVLRGVKTRLGDAPKEDEAGVSLLVRIVGDRCTISLDASGEPLHRRGYRRDPHRAPLREDLARALVKASGWDRKSVLVDPMCGSGTVAIEAAMLAMDRAPGLTRAFDVERTPLDDGLTLAAVRAEASARIRPVSHPVVARDRDFRAIEAACSNAGRAGVMDALIVEEGALSTTVASLPADLGPGPRLVTNPPWGARLGDGAALRPLYRALGQLRRHLGPGGGMLLAAHDRRLAYATGVPLESAFLSDLGGLKVHAMVERAGGGEVAGARGVH